MRAGRYLRAMPFASSEAIKFGDKGFKLLRVAFLLRTIELFVKFADFAIGFQLVLITTDYFNELLSILDSRLRGLGVAPKGTDYGLRQTKRMAAQARRRVPVSSSAAASAANR